MDKQHVGVCIPVADVRERQFGSGNRFAVEVHIVDSPRIRPVVIQIDLLGTTRSYIWSCRWSLKRECIGQRAGGPCEKRYRGE